MSEYPRVALAQVMKQDTNYITELEPRLYPKLSVKLYGRGVGMDAPTDGSTVRMARHQLAKPGQIILSEIWGKKGAIGVVPTEGAGALVTSHFFLFDIDPAQVLLAYLDWLFRGNYLTNVLEAQAHGTTGYAAVRPKQFLALEIPLPSLPEQHRIVARIEALARRVEEAHRLGRAALAEANLLMQANLVRIFGNTHEHRRAKLTRVSTFQRGRFSHRPRNDPLFYGGPYPFIQINDIAKDRKYISSHSQTLNENGLKISRVFSAGTLVISIAATIGAVGILSFDSCMPDSLVGITPNSASTSTDYLYYFLRFERSRLSDLALCYAEGCRNLLCYSEPEQ